MAESVNVEDYKAFSAKLKAADKAVARGVRKALRESTKTLGEDILAEGSEPMPSSGGLRERLLGSKKTLSITATRAALVLRNKGVRLDALNRGELRHPLFGNRRVWLQQSVPADTYTRAWEKRKEDVVGVFSSVIDQSLKELS